MNDSNFLKEIGRSYIVSSFLPASLFVSLASILFRSFINPILVSDLAKDNFLFGNQWLLPLIITLWIAFYLFSSVDWTVKLFEGYFFSTFLKDILRVLFFRFRFASAAPTYFKLDKIKNKKRKSKRDLKTFQDLRMDAMAELQELEIESPVDAKFLMPTRLGNVLRASEIYAFERYCIEGITIWPRLFHVLPLRFIKDLEEKNNHLLFLLNSSLLAYINAIACILLGVSALINKSNTGQFYISLVPKQMALFNGGFDFISPVDYIVIGLALIGFAYGLYSVAVNAAEDYGLFVRAGFDLYRLDLLKQLRQPLPKELRDEKQTWLTLTEYFIAANHLGMVDINFPYSHYEKSSVANGESDSANIGYD